MRAIVIDDSRAIRGIIKKLLAAEGFDVSEAGNGIEGLAVLRAEGPPDVALVDWNMPEMNGLEFVKAVRSDASYNDMRLMMVTTETEVERITEALDAGANEYAMKPFTAEVLREKLELLGVGGI
jgi:two-component system chemotaxis response regulator CheY